MLFTTNDYLGPNGYYLAHGSFGVLLDRLARLMIESPVASPQTVRKVYVGFVKIPLIFYTRFTIVKIPLIFKKNLPRFH